MSSKMWYRKTLRYRVKMWFYRLTFKDIKCAMRICAIAIFEFIMCAIGFIILMVLPALFH